MRNTTTDEPVQAEGTQTAQTLSGLQKETTGAFQPTQNQSDVKVQPKSIQLLEKNKRRALGLTRLQLLSRRTRVVAIVIASIIAALFVVFLYQQIAVLATVTWDDVHYGRPRTFQVDAFVGHETGKTPSHFIALNLHGHIEIFELPGGDAARVREYDGPQLVGSNADLIPPTLQFVNTSNSRIKDMILQAGNVEIYYHNVQGTFRAS
jgi:hypothetical protein